MKNKKRNITIKMILYYTICPIFFLYSFTLSTMFSIISNFSNILFYILYLFFPIILLLLPLFIKYILKKDMEKSLKYSLITFIIYLLFTIILSFSIKTYFKTFTTKKWTKEEWHDLRYLMIDDLENKYTLVGMNKKEISRILGKENDYLIQIENRNSEEENKSEKHILLYTIRNGFLEGDNYNIYLDENNIVTETSISHWN